MPADVADDLFDHLPLESGKKQFPQLSVPCQHFSRYPRDRPRRPTQPAEDASFDIARTPENEDTRPTTAVIARRLVRRVAQVQEINGIGARTWDDFVPATQRLAALPPGAPLVVRVRRDQEPRTLLYSVGQG